MGSGGGGMDPLEDMAASTVAMLILFGSTTFATVSMLTRTLLLGDKRAIMVATTIKLKSPFAANTSHEEPQQLETQPENEFDTINDTTNLKKSAESIVSSSDTIRTRDKSIRSKYSRSVVSSRSVAHARNTSFSAEGNTISNIKMRESAFVQIFVLMYHLMVFGFVLLGIYLLDKYPLNGRSKVASAQKVLSEPFHFNADQFLSWMIIIAVYAFYTTWQRNDGKSADTKGKQKAHDANNAPDAETEVQSTKDVESPLYQTQQHGQSNRDEASIISKGSSHTGLSKRLEEIMLEEVLGHDDHDTIGDAFENTKRDTKSWIEKAIGMFGFKMNESSREGIVHECTTADDILNPLQTLEWKGMLSIALLLYQFCSAGRGGTYKAQVNPDDELYESFDSPAWRNLELVAFSGFLFMTGYNHTCYYYYHPDNQKSPIEYTPYYYGLSRILGVLFRWNWTAAFLSLTLGNNLFEHYAACPIHSFSFLAIWLMLRTYHSINYTKYRFRCKVLAFVCIVVSSDMILAKSFRASSARGTLWELRYLCYLHNLAPVVGVMFAINKPIASFQLRKLESQSVFIAALSKGIVCLAVTTATIIWASGPLQRDSYSKTHVHFGVVPLLAYIYLRNSSRRFRSHHSRFFSWVGQYSLEIFLLTKHTLFHDSLFVILAGYPHLSFLLVATGIICLSRLLNNLTRVMSQVLISHHEENSTTHISTFSVGVLCLYLFAQMLCWADLVSTGSIATIVIILGVLLYQVIMDMSWDGHQRSSGHLSTPAGGSGGTKMVVPISGVTSICLLTAIWYGWASITGASSVLDASCLDFVNNGSWLPINACYVNTGPSESINYFGHSECGNYTVAKEWIWPKKYSKCSFHFRSDNDIRTALLHKRVTFVGDSSIRSLFYSLVRSMGDHNAGGYEGIASHSDLRRLFPSANIEYKWSPLTVDVVTKLKTTRTAPSGKPKPDLLVVGGGTWEKLHIKATDEDQNSHKDTVERLAYELNKLQEQGVVVVWVIPPFVNTVALNSDEKRAQMSEESLEETRQLYRDLGVEGSATFVLEGPTFTKDRVADSFDGIDFPIDVYDAGIQILANALEWLIETIPADEVEALVAEVDISTNPFLNAQMLVFALIGLFFFDAYFGLSYLPQLCTRDCKVAPSDIYQDAMNTVFSKHEVDSNDRRRNAIEGEEVMELLGRPMRSERSVHSSASLSRRR